MEEESIKDMVRSFFIKLYADEGAPYTPYLLPHNRFPLLSREEMAQVASPFTGCDIKKAIFEMDPFKAPGPDGFQALFCQRY